MGFSSLKQYTLALLLTAVSSTTAFAAPKLRLSTTTLGPISIAQGQNGKTQSLGAYNAGDASLNLSFASSVPWLTAQIGSNIPCSNNLALTCTGINVGLATSGLSKGTVTGTLRISDPNALDAPQDVTVTVQVGGGVPDSLSFYVPPNGANVKQSIKTSTNFAVSANPPGGGVSLTLVSNGGGSFATTFGYDVVVNARQGTSEGTYTASLNVSGSSISSDNKQVPVTIQVTSQPIATPNPASIYLKIATSGTPQSVDVSFSNAGLTDLTISGADPGASTWLTAQINGNTVTASADPSGLVKGVYNGSLTIASNAANPVVVPVTLEVVDPGPPVSRYQSVVSLAGSAPSSDAVALGDIVTIQGELFTTQSTQSADSTQPLPTSLGGATVYVNDIAAPIFSVSSSSIQFQVPYEVNWGDATVRVDRDGTTGNTLSLAILPAAPRVTSVQNQNGVTVATAAGPQATVAVGDTLTFFGYGFGQTGPAVSSGTPAPDGSTLDPSLIVRFSTGGLFGLNLTVSPQSANLVTGSIGLYQVAVQVPDNTPHGASIPITIELPGVAASKPVYLNIP